ncbi:universal stress protein [Dyadobacter psychrotolerans]|uniref:Universal stress protein n=1 Tax=Dyadobacter psychrotolerans TaxID=2541721 RepID=A0A4R5D8T5_9BACT|nr:universal stress protein [Dyadobacter psychrotolerans]TDE08151.1 universal stress protein [Dyadobacter psychrotolerans]
MKKILVPCDFSPCCENALRFAIELAGKCRAEVIILTILRLPEKLSDTKDLYLYRKQAKSGFEKIKKIYQLPIRIRHEITVGKILPEILGCITRKNINLVVMGTKGSRGWEQVFMGSNTEKVVRASPVPVLSIKGLTAVGLIKNIVIPCDLRHHQYEFIEKVKFLQKTFQARLHLLRINTDVRIKTSTLESRLQEYVVHYGLGDTTCNVRFEDDEREGIVHFVKEMNADMIAMSTHGNLDAGHLFATSIAADVVNHANIPVWTCAVNKKLAEPAPPIAGKRASTNKLLSSKLTIP